MHLNLILPAAKTEDASRHYAVYVFRQKEGTDSLSKPLHARWQREAISETVEAALTRAALVREEEGVTRIQIYEMIKDKNGLVRTGRIIKTLGQTFWHKLRRKRK